MPCRSAIRTKSLDDHQSPTQACRVQFVVQALVEICGLQRHENKELGLSCQSDIEQSTEIPFVESRQPLSATFFEGLPIAMEVVWFVRVCRAKFFTLLISSTLPQSRKTTSSREIC